MGKKNIQNWIAAVCCIAVITFAGCGKDYEKKQPDTVASLKLDAMLNEKEGYHIPGLSWDMDKEEVEEAVGASLGKPTQGMQKTYFLDHEDVEKIDSYATSNIDYAFSPEGKLVTVTYNFSTGEDSEYTSEDLDQLYAMVTEEFTKAYEEADVTDNDSVEQGKTTYYTETFKWEQELPDGRTSSLQIVRANTGEDTEVVSVGVVVYSEEEGS